MSRTFTAIDWKRFYAAERDALGSAGLGRWVRRAQTPALPRRGALVFPHTRLGASGHLTAAVARSLVASGCERVLALGVLHGARRSDSELVRRARAGDPEARELLRRVHRPGPDGHASEEFSLDGLRALLGVAAEIEGRPAPELVERYPFLTGNDPASLPGIDELEALVAEGVPVVATADMVHHGIGYATPSDQAMPAESRDTLLRARAMVEEQLDALGSGRLDDLLAACERYRSDFRDAGPVLGHLLGRAATPVILDLVLIGYADVLAAPEPTWVAATLAGFSCG